MRASNSIMKQYAHQFTTIYDGQPWYGDSISKVLLDITPAKAFWQPSNNAHSIAQILSHIIYWRQKLIKKLEGDIEYQASVKSDDNWKSNERLKKDGWKSLRKLFGESQTQLITQLKKQKETLLKEKYSDNVTFQDLINGILQHDLYHLGQIAYLKNIYIKK